MNQGRNKGSREINLITETTMAFSTRTKANRVVRLRNETTTTTTATTITRGREIFRHQRTPNLNLLRESSNQYQPVKNVVRIIRGNAEEERWFVTVAKRKATLLISVRTKTLMERDRIGIANKDHN